MVSRICSGSGGDPFRKLATTELILSRHGTDGLNPAPGHFGPNDHRSLPEVLT
jgi:hypothetical protein